MLLSRLAYTPALGVVPETKAAAPYQVPQHYLFRPSGYLTGSDPRSPLLIAQDYLRANAGALGLTSHDVLNAVITDFYRDADTGLSHLYLAQSLNGLAIRNTSLTITVGATGGILNVAGGFVPDAQRYAATDSPLVDAVGAARAASLLGLPDATPAVISTDPSLPITIMSDATLSLDPIKAQLFYLASESGLHLVWNMALRTPDNQHWYDVNVDARTSQLLETIDWVDGAAYNVYARPTETPHDGPGGVGSRITLTDPHDSVHSPYGWHDTNGVMGPEYTDTRGNNVFAQEDADANNSGGYRPDGGLNLTFDFPVDLTQSPSAYRDAAITNLFYWNNLAHDLFATYGFTEVAGNFQFTNYSGQGLGNDAVQADAQDGSGTNNANFSTPPDGSAPRMQMYLFNYTAPNRDGDFDNMIIVHEYGHGVSNRLTGGPANAGALSAVQSGGMGEGWSDFFGLMFTQKTADTKMAAYPVGTYVLGQTETGTGIRRYPYSFDMSRDPLTINDYNLDSSHQVHRTGEIWCSTLWDLNWLLIDKYGFDPDITKGYTGPGSKGNILALKLVMDALKIQPANPSFKNARDAIIQADAVLTGGANIFEIWTAFARRGMGYSFVNASSNGTSVTPATDLPPGLLSPSIIAHTPVGLATGVVNTIDLTFSRTMDPASFSIANDIVSFTRAGVDIQSQITGFTWTNSDQTLRLNVTGISVDGLYSLVLGPQILGTDGKAMDQNHNGTTGEPGDTYTATFSYDSLVGLVVSTTPAPDSLVTLPMTTLDLVFNEDIAAASIGTSDLTLSQGAVVTATALSPNSVRYTLSGIISEGTLAVSLAAGALTDVAGNPISAYSAAYALDTGVIPFPTPLLLKPPLGGLIYTGSHVGTIGAVADTDSFTIAVEAGQTLTITLLPIPGLQPTLTLLDPANVVIATVSAATKGREIMIQALPITVAGTYTVVAGSLDGTGNYTLGLTLNAAREAESHGGPTNDSLPTAQDLGSAFTPVGTGERAAVIGTLPSATGLVVASEDWETGTIGPAWTTYSSNASIGRIQVLNNQGSASPPYALLMDASLSGSYNLNEAIWTVNLSGLSVATVTFHQSNQNDESDVLPANWVGHANGDGVSFSADGNTWYRIWQGDSIATGTTFTQVTVDLAAAATAAGIPLSSITRIKFQQYDDFSLGTDGRGFDKIAISTPAPQDDYYKLTLNAGDSLSLAIVRQGATGGESIRLLDSSGTVLAMGGAGAASLDQVLRDFVAPAAGTYYVRVSGVDVTYDLILTRNASFDAEANDTIATAQKVLSSPVTGTLNVLGAISGNVDVYSLQFTAGNAVQIFTRTPGDGAGEFANALDARIRILDAAGNVLASDDNSDPDGRNALLNFLPDATGPYFIEVSAPGSGEYVLQITGAAAPPAPLTVASVTPANGISLSIVPTQATLSFSNAVLLTSIQAGDLRIDGTPATAFTIVDDRSIRFALPVITSGTHTLTLAAGDILDVSGNTVAAFSSSFVLDTTPPRITNSSIQGGDVRSPGSLTLSFTFHKPMLATNLDASDFTLTGNLRAVTYTPTSFAFSAGDTILTVSYNALPEDNYTFTLLSGNGRFEDAAGLDLDGEANFPIPPNTSGNGAAGGNFVANFSIDNASTPITTLSPIVPVGNLVHTGSASGILGNATDSDSFTITLEAGQVLSVFVHPTTSTLRPSVTVTGPGGAVLGTATAGAANQDAFLQTVAITAPGVYTITASQASAVTGWYSVDLFLNSAIEAERHNGPANDTTATAQSLASAAQTLPGGGTLASVVGTLVSGNSDYYALSLTAGQSISIFMASLTGGTGTVRLLDSSGALVALSSTSASNVLASIDTLIVPSTGTYYVKIEGGSLTYALSITTNLAFDFESNDTLGTAQNIGPNSTVLGAITGGGNAGSGLKMGLIQDSNPWGSSSNNTVATSLGYSVTLIPSSTLATVNLSQFDMIVLAGDQSTSTYSLFQTNLPRIESYVSAGGVLIVNNAASSVSTPYSYDLLPGAAGVTFTGTTGADINVLAPASALITGPGGIITNTTLDGGTSSYHGYTTSTLPTGATAILSTASASQIEAFDYPFGTGRVIVHEIPVEYYGGGGNFGIFHKNLFNFGASFRVSNPDYYTIDLTAGVPLQLRTLTPFDGPEAPVNTFDAALELFDPSGAKVATDDNSAPDGRNAIINFTPTVSGTYKVRVYSTPAAVTQGEYILHVTGAAETPVPPMSVTSITPANGSVLLTAPTQATLTFSNPILFSTLQASDLLLDGTPFTAFTVVNDRTLTFTLPTLADGTHTFTMTAGALMGIRGTPLADFTSSFKVDATPPRIIGSSLQQGDIKTPGPLTYVVTFSKPMLASNLDPSDYSLTGAVRGVSYTPASALFSAGNTVLTLTYPTLPEDNYTFNMLSGNGRFEDTNGIDLDGEPNFPIPPNTSGNGIAGGNFAFNFIVDQASGAFPVLTPRTPLGSLVYTGSATGLIGPSSDTDSFTFSLEAGQVLSLALRSTGFSLRPKLTLTNAGAIEVASAIAASANQDALIQFQVPTAGLYTITAASADTSAGSYSLYAVLNAVMEAEDRGGPTNNTPATAQNLDGTLLPLGNGSYIGAVVGNSASNGSPAPTAPGTAYTGARDFPATPLSIGVAADGSLVGPGVGARYNTTEFLRYGTHLAGFSVGYNGMTFTNGTAGGNGTAFPVTLSDISSGTLHGVRITGTINAILGFQRTIWWYDGDAYALVSTVLTNKTGTPLANVALLDNQDPDPGGTFESSNDVVIGASGKLISGSRAGAAMALGSLDSRAVVSSEGFFISNPFDVINSPVDPNGVAADTSINMAFNLGTLAGGQSVASTFAMVFGTSPAEVQTTYDAIATKTLSITNDDEYYAVTLAAGESLSVALATAGAGTPELRLYDAANTLAATGTGTAANVSRAIDAYIAPTSGTYYIRVSNVSGDYNLVLSRNAALDLEPNSSIATATPLNQRVAAVGYVQGSPSLDGDYFAVTLGAGDILSLRTQTPGSLSAMLNALDPQVDIYDAGGTRLASDDNSGADGRNALLSFTAGTAGTYYVRIRPSETSATSGEYTLESLVFPSGLAPTMPDLLASGDTGILNTDNITQLNNLPGRLLQFQVGATLPGATVVLYADGTPIGSAIANGYVTLITTDGTTPLLDGTHLITARQTPAGQAESAASEALSLTVLSSAPAAPAALVLQALSDTGLSNSDRITNRTNPLFDVGPGAYYRVYRDGMLISGTYESGAVFTGLSFADGTWFLHVINVDAAGNESAPSAPLVITIDTVAPATPGAPDLATDSDTGANTTDNLTRDSTPTFTVPAAPYRMLRDGTQVGGDYLVGPYTSDLLADGAYAFSLQAVDVAGNVSPAGPSLSVTIDTAAPTAGIPDLSNAHDTGFSDSDNVTSATRPFVDLFIPAAGTVSLYIDGAFVEGRTSSVSTIISIQSPLLADGVHAFQMTLTDLTGNVSPLGSPLSVTIDSLAPTAPPTPDLDDLSDTGLLSSDNITRDNTPTLNIAGAPYYRLTANGVQVGPAYNTASAYTLDAQPDGTWTFAVVAVDAAGNVSAPSANLVVTIDNVQPAVTADSLTTDNPAPALSGTASDPAASIEVTINGISYTAANNGNGTWSLPAGTVAPALLAGLYNVVAVATDLAGNAATSTGGGELRIRPPVATIDPLPLRSQGLSRLIKWAPVPGAEEYLVQCATTDTFDDVTASSGWSSDTSFTFLNLADGVTYYYRVQSRTEIDDDAALDSEMLLSNWSSAAFSTQDATAPALGFTDLVTGDSTPPVAGAIDDSSATIKLTLNGTDYAPVNNGDGTWTLADGIISPALPLGVHGVIITATDAAGNVTTLNGSIHISPPLADTNGDGKVDAFDLNKLAANWQQPTTAGTPDGDFNNDGMVDAFDLNALAAQWQTSTATEPPPPLTFESSFTAEPVSPVEAPETTPETPLAAAVESDAVADLLSANTLAPVTARALTIIRRAPIAEPVVDARPIHRNPAAAAHLPAPAIVHAKRPAEAPAARKFGLPQFSTRLPAIVQKIRRLINGDEAK